MNKKGDEKVLSIWMFLIFGLIALAIFVNVAMFYGQEFEIKEVQAEVLASRLRGCFSSLENVEEFSIESCNIRELDESFYFNVSVYQDEKLVRDFYSGDVDFEIQCRLTGSHFAECVSESLSVGDFDVEIYAGSNFEGGRF